MVVRRPLSLGPAWLRPSRHQTGLSARSKQSTGYSTHTWGCGQSHLCVILQSNFEERRLAVLCPWEQSHRALSVVFQLRSSRISGHARPLHTPFPEPASVPSFQ